MSLAFSVDPITNASAIFSSSENLSSLPPSIPEKSEDYIPSHVPISKLYLIKHVLNEVLV